VVAERVGDSRF